MGQKFAESLDKKPGTKKSVIEFPTVPQKGLMHQHMAGERNSVNPISMLRNLINRLNLTEHLHSLSEICVKNNYELSIVKKINFNTLLKQFSIVEKKEFSY